MVLLALTLSSWGAWGDGGSHVTDSGASSSLSGRSIYQQYCVSCHGEAGEGAENWKNRNEAGELPAPPHDETGHTWRHKDSMLFRMIAEGWRDPFNKTDHLTMPAFEDQLGDDERHRVIEYLKTLWTDEQRSYQLKESQKGKNTSAPPS